MNIQRSKREQSQVSDKYLSPSTFNSCGWKFEMLVCLSGPKGSKTQLRNHEVSKWSLREDSWLQDWILPFSQQPAFHFCLILPQRPNITTGDRKVPAPGSPIPPAVLSWKHLHWCLKVSLWCAGGRGLRDKGRGISYRQKKSATVKSATIWFWKSLC